MRKFRILLFTTVLACAMMSCTRRFMGSFSGEGHIPERSNYLELDNGQKVYGDKINLSKMFSNSLTIDGQKFKIAEVKGFANGGIYYGRLNKVYILRVISGKLSVYFNIINMSDRDGTVIIEAYYMQKEGEKEMKRIYTHNDLKKALESCPAAYALVDISAKQMRRAIRKNHSYLDQAIGIYNNGCAPVASH